MIKKALLLFLLILPLGCTLQKDLPRTERLVYGQNHTRSDQTKPIYYIEDKAWILQLACYNSHGTTQTIGLYEKGKPSTQKPIWSRKVKCSRDPQHPQHSVFQVGHPTMIYRKTYYFTAYDTNQDPSKTDLQMRITSK